MSGKGIDLSTSCENEWLCSKIAKAFGFDVANAEVVTFGSQKALSVERFDRKWSSNRDVIFRLPQEDMCQALGISSASKYENEDGPGILDVMTFLSGSAQSAKDKEVFFKTQVLFWLLAATDGHSKNFSIFIEGGGRYKLTPLYDILSVYPLIESGNLQRQKAKLAMGLHGKQKHYLIDKILPRHFISTGVKVGISEDQATGWLFDMLAKVPQVVSDISVMIPEGFPRSVSEPILAGLSAMHAANIVLFKDENQFVLESAKKIFDCASSVQDIGRLAEENLKLNSMINEMYKQGNTGDTWSKACDLSNDILTKIALLASECQSASKFDQVSALKFDHPRT
jgi:hypothetical protein